MHARHYIHGDLKLENVLVLGDHGFVNDFGFLTEVTKKLPCDGIPLYMAPETIFGPKPRMADPKQDMFSLGLILLAIVKPEFYNEWQARAEVLRENVEKGQLAADAYEKEYKDAHTALQIFVGRNADPFMPLIHELISYDPKGRPSCEEAEERFTQLLTEQDTQPVIS
jgi:serine/threonine protein kinase